MFIDFIIFSKRNSARLIYRYITR